MIFWVKENSDLLFSVALVRADHTAESPKKDSTQNAPARGEIYERQCILSSLCRTVNNKLN
jgi:hypothetical protein